MVVGEDILEQIDPDNHLINNFCNQVNSDYQSDYHTIEQFNERFLDHNQFFSLCNYNIRSFNANYDGFYALLSSITPKFCIIVLTETRFSESLTGNISG